MSTGTAFRPEDHFRSLKGQQYLECKWRIVWFREEHPDGYIRTEMIEHEPGDGLAVFKAQAGHWTPEGREVYATGYGSETRKDFGDYLEKAETKAVARALAMLGYGTAQAIELDEGERIVDSPVDRQQSKTRTPLAVVPAPVDVEALRAEVEARLHADPDAASKLPKAAADMSAEELTKTLSWMTRRARVSS